MVQITDDIYPYAKKVEDVRDKLDAAYEIKRLQIEVKQAFEFIDLLNNQCKFLFVCFILLSLLMCVLIIFLSGT